MKSKTFVMMFVAIGCGLVAAYLTARITAKQAAPETVPVLVAKERIKAGDVIKEPEKLFVEMRYPAGSTPNAVSSLEDLKGKMVNKTIQPGQWLTPDDISGNFGIELPKGYYAMAVKVAPETAASGFILPQSRVNVVATVRPNGGLSRPRVVTVLQDVLVLAVDTMIVRPEDRMAVPQATTALLAVKPADSQKLSLAQSMSGGELRLVLRSHDDENRVPLPALENLEIDAASFDATAAAATTPLPTFKLVVAKKDLDPDTEIDNPSELFEVKEFASAPEKAVAGDDLGSLKGKTLKAAVFKDGVLTAKHFEAKDKVALVSARPEPKRHVLFVQNGGTTPITQIYRLDLEGKVVPSDEAPAAEPTGKPEAEKPEAEKPEATKPPEDKPETSGPIE